MDKFMHISLNVIAASFVIIAIVIVLFTATDAAQKSHEDIRAERLNLNTSHATHASQY